MGGEMPVLYVQNAGTQVGNSIGLHCKDRLHGISIDMGIEHVKVICNELGTSDIVGTSGKPEEFLEVIES